MVGFIVVKPFHVAGAFLMVEGCGIVEGSLVWVVGIEILGFVDVVPVEEVDVAPGVGYFGGEKRRWRMGVGGVEAFDGVRFAFGEQCIK